MWGTSADNTKWNAEREALLRELNGTMPNARIAEEINARTGSSFSRNSIIGKRSREGLIVDRAQRPYQRRKDRIGLDIADLFKPLEPPPPPAEFLGLTFDELENFDGRCRYPRGEKPYLFCGQPAKEGSSYCPSCHAICYPPRKNQDARRERDKLIRYLERML